MVYDFRLRLGMVLKFGRASGLPLTAHVRSIRAVIEGVLVKRIQLRDVEVLVMATVDQWEEESVTVYRIVVNGLRIEKSSHETFRGSRQVSRYRASEAATRDYSSSIEAHTHNNHFNMSRLVLVLSDLFIPDRAIVS